MKKFIKKFPGFRTGVLWKQSIAIAVYSVFTVFTVLAFMQSVVFAGLTTTLFIISLIFLFDLGNVWLRLSLPRNDPLLKFFLIFIFILIIFSFWFVLVPQNFFSQTFKKIQAFTRISTTLTTPIPFDFPDEKK